MALNHPFFEEIRNGKIKNGEVIVPEDLLIFTQNEIEYDKENYQKLINKNNE